MHGLSALGMRARPARNTTLMELTHESSHGAQVHPFGLIIAMILRRRLRRTIVRWILGRFVG
jgi:hypothetical protein